MILIPTITKQDISEIKDITDKIQKCYDEPENKYDQIAAIYFGSILGNTYDKNEIEEIFNETKARLCSNHSLFTEVLGIKKADEN